MRDRACREWVRLFEDRSFVFLTGDLGFRALEPLRDVMGERFINAGVAEQNMVSVAAGLASGGIDVWVYSIAPFLYARPFEQIRNDICMHDLPVKLVGNGGGYGYGAMGASHHALEDYGALLGLPKMHAFVPAFASDLEQLIPRLARFPHPAYLRLGRCEKPDGVVSFGVVVLLGIIQATAKLLFPDLAPRGVTTLMLMVMAFGAVNLLSLGLLGEYIAKIFEEVKRRPHFVRRSIIQGGEVRDASEEVLHRAPEEAGR